MKRDRIADEPAAMDLDDAAEPQDPYFEGYMRPSVHRVMLR